MNEILERFGKVKFGDHPYPHFVVDDFLPDDVFQSLKKEFPTDEEFNSLKNESYGVSAGRLDIEKNSALYQYVIHKSKTWKAFSDTINSDDFFQLFLEKWWPSAEENGVIPIQTTAKFIDRTDGTQSENKSRLYNSTVAFFRDYGFRTLYRRFRRIFSPDDFYSVLNIARMVPGYTVYPHTDNRYKVIVFLLYLDEKRRRWRSCDPFVLC
jgi:hypothetical protein